jgi:hypothetical protein
MTTTTTVITRGIQGAGVASILPVPVSPDDNGKVPTASSGAYVLAAPASTDLAGYLNLGTDNPHDMADGEPSAYARTTYTMTYGGPQIVKLNSTNLGPMTVVLPTTGILGAPVGYAVLIWDPDGAVGSIPNASDAVVDVQIDIPANSQETIIDGDAGVGQRVYMLRSNESLLLVKISQATVATWDGMAVVDEPAGQWMVVARNWRKDYAQGDIQTVSANATVGAASENRVILVDTAAASGGVTITMPLEVPVKTRVLVKDKTGSASTKNITVVPNPSDGPSPTIDGGASKVISANYGALWLLKISQDDWITE